MDYHMAGKHYMTLLSLYDGGGNTAKRIKVDTLALWMIWFTSWSIQSILRNDRNWPFAFFSNVWLWTLFFWLSTFLSLKLIDKRFCLSNNRFFWTIIPQLDILHFPIALSQRLFKFLANLFDIVPLSLCSHDKVDVDQCFVKFTLMNIKIFQSFAYFLLRTVRTPWRILCLIIE